MGSILRPRTVGVAGLGFLLVVAACGSDNSGGSAATTAAATTAAATTAAATTTAASTASTTAGGATTTGGAGGAAIKIGVAVPDYSVFEQQAKQFGVGDPQEQAAAILDGWKKNGQVPVNGHDVQFVYRKFNVIKDDEKLAACTAFAQDDKVVAVIGSRDFGTGAQCLSQRFNIPVIDVNAVPTSQYQAAGKGYFTLRPDQNLFFTQYIDWADKNGYLKDKKIGAAFTDDVKEAYDAAKAELQKKGYQLTSEFSVSGAGVGSDQDALAAQKFQADGVDLILPFVGGSDEIQMLGAAAKQNYAPKVVDLENSEHTTDVAAALFPASIYEGTPAITTARVGELATNKKLVDAAETCIANYERFSGKKIDRVAPETSGEFTNILITCDVANLMLAAIKNAGATVDAASIVKGFESISNMSLASAGNATFTSTDHWGVHEYRSIQFSEACKCWQTTGDFQKFTVAG
jgi:hypothetical protein